MQNNNISGIQADILRQLFRKDSMRFSEINVHDVPSDQFSYHLRQLVKHGLIEKSTDNTYSLSTLGKTRTIMLYPNKNGFIEQGFMAVRLVITKQENDKQYYLMQERMLVPYRGTYATPGNKILFGEDALQTAQRVLRQETGLSCKLTFVGLRHIKDEFLGKIVQDKYFFVFAGSEPLGKLIPGSPKKNLWLTYDEIKSSGRSIHDGLAILDMGTNNTPTFSEQTIVVDSY